MSNLPSASAPLVYDHVVGAPVAFLAYTPTGAPPGAPTLWVQFDCVTSEQWTEDAEVTEHPVEEGADIADNVRVALPKCQLEVFTSNEPIQDNLFTQLQDLPLPLTVQTPSWVKPSGLLTVSGWKSNQGLRNLARSLSGLGGSLIGGATLGGENGFLVGALAGVAATVIGTTPLWTAAIAALFANCVVNPQSAGLGGGFHMTIYDPTSKSARCLDARETAPLAATENMFQNDLSLSKKGFKKLNSELIIGRNYNFF